MRLIVLVIVVGMALGNPVQSQANIDPDALEAKVVALENGIKDLDYEVALVISPVDGSLVATYTQKGCCQVVVPIGWYDDIVTHNHPGNVHNLSLTDFVEGMGDNYEQLRVVTTDGTRCAMLRGGSDNWNDINPVNMGMKWSTFTAQANREARRNGWEWVFTHWVAGSSHVYKCWEE